MFAGISHVLQARTGMPGDDADATKTVTLRFHVDALSSAHVYVRLPKGMSIDDIDNETLEDCAQLVKANSIQGLLHNGHVGCALGR